MDDEGEGIGSNFFDGEPDDSRLPNDAIDQFAEEVYDHLDEQLAEDELAQPTQTVQPEPQITPVEHQLTEAVEQVYDQLD